AGQKCSACSRVLVDERVASTFLKRFSKATEDVVVGKAHHRETQINPLISSREKQRLLSMEEEILKEVQDFGGKVHANRLGGEFPGHSVGPLVVELPSSRAFIQDSFFQQELFAPVVHVVTYKGLDEAIRLFNATPYALTGGIYAGSQDDIDFLSQGMECGNLYVNRPNTGARVGVEPFGGFKLSGTGPKAGHGDYVKAFMVKSSEERRATKSQIISSPKNCKDRKEEAKDENFTWAKPLSIKPFERGRLLARFLGSFDTFGSFPKLEHWLTTELEGLIERKGPNLAIPGQLSYNDFHLPRKNVILLAKAFESQFCSHTLLSLVAAIAAGSSLNIVSDSKSDLAPWAQAADHLFKAGLPKTALCLGSLSPKGLKLLLGDSKISACIFHGSLESFERWIPFLYPGTPRPKHLRRICHPFDGGDPSLDDYPDRVLQFIEIRSFAVNIMRYGAPLELDFSQMEKDLP
ncbi:MAG: aldehyde dehydrogenase family protein, partial [Bacteriovoracales bacterium]|nr:aldehyde dehydrogenase family protein [Bacteriovoracales bacterium]